MARASSYNPSAFAPSPRRSEARARSTISRTRTLFAVISPGPTGKSRYLRLQRGYLAQPDASIQREKWLRSHVWISASPSGRCKVIDVAISTASSKPPIRPPSRLSSSKYAPKRLLPAGTSFARVFFRRWVTTTGLLKRRPCGCMSYDTNPLASETIVMLVDLLSAPTGNEIEKSEPGIDSVPPQYPIVPETLLT